MAFTPDPNNPGDLGTETMVDMMAKSETPIVIDKRSMLESLPSLLNTYMGRKSLSTEVLFESVGLSRAFGYRVMKGERRPSRSSLISIAFELDLTYDEAQYLLKVGRVAQLTPREERDKLILEELLHKKRLAAINDLLIEKGYEPLVENP